MIHTDIVAGLEKLGRRVLPSGAQLILFGSQARGDAHEGSDWDVLILIEGTKATGEDFDRLAYPFVEFGWQKGEQINPLIYSFDEWERRKSTPFYNNVIQEGINLCR